ncbi:hypothetical protein IMZ11_05940 [Microtetraspora sp. AC03309]|uniref:hypothetical protein n=1 Tax=Microtetraspora sp. AC03309 TaxID=2779376 RepID=UPI001E2F7F82|nr:hypothetical protein [Microtetraspora sp. AC03309]MCC5575180.1 hypothetical protein [Microtetraspora sp. AC03309]
MPELPDLSGLSPSRRPRWRTALALTGATGVVAVAGLGVFLGTTRDADGDNGHGSDGGPRLGVLGQARDSRPLDHIRDPLGPGTGGVQPGGGTTGGGAAGGSAGPTGMGAPGGDASAAGGSGTGGSGVNSSGVNGSGMNGSEADGSTANGAGVNDSGGERAGSGTRPAPGTPAPAGRRDPGWLETPGTSLGLLMTPRSIPVPATQLRLPPASGPATRPSPVPIPPPRPTRDAGADARTKAAVPGKPAPALSATPGTAARTAAAPERTAIIEKATVTGRTGVARRTPAKPSHRDGPRSRPFPDPCATFHDVRRDYCYQLLDSFTAPRR